MDRGFVLSDHVDWPSLLSAIDATGAETVWVTHGYREPVVRWLHGRNPAPGASHELLAQDLAAVVTALRQLDVPSEARTDPELHWYRADPLTGDRQSCLE